MGWVGGAGPPGARTPSNHSQTPGSVWGDDPVPARGPDAARAGVGCADLGKQRQRSAGCWPAAEDGRWVRLAKWGSCDRHRAVLDLVRNPLVWIGVAIVAAGRGAARIRVAGLPACAAGV